MLARSALELARTDLEGTTGSRSGCPDGNNGPVTAANARSAGSPTGTLEPAIADLLQRDSAGLVAAVIQQYDTHEVLMVGWMNDVALHATLTTGRTTFWSRSRQELWVKGETSGHRQWVREVSLDCDGDTLLVKVDQEGGACHTGDRTCFDARVLLGADAALARLRAGVRA